MSHAFGNQEPRLGRIGDRRGRSGYAASMTPRVEVHGTARLHLGFLDLNGSLGRRFGSIGLSLDAPATRVLLRPARSTTVQGPDSDRAARHLDVMVRHFGLSPGHDLRIEQAIPAHAGLGSGTQLALAIGAAVRALHGLPTDPEQDAVLLERGGRSGIGVGLFSAGGCVVDGGHGEATLVPPVLVRLPVPELWRILLVLDRSREGLSGAVERAAFAKLPRMADATAARLCRLVLMQALPALAEEDLPRFGDAVTLIQRAVGDYFAAAQGGRFTSPRVSAAVDAMAAAGAVGIGQSSWGPTGFAFVPDETAARTIAEAVAGPLAEGLDIMVCRGLNRGATVTAVAGEAAVR
jgi:beta-RFAP synthase